MLFITDETPDLIKHSAGAYHPDADGICFFVGREIGFTGVQPRSCVSIEIENMLNNIITYVYSDEDEHNIEIKVELSGDRLTVSITDDGIPFNPFGIETPDTKLSIEERKIGGLGVHLVRKVMDKVSYQRRIDKNVITLVKDMATATQ